jgi:broad specificity phosphatase PhoE
MKIFYIRHGTTEWNAGSKKDKDRVTYKGRTVDKDYNPGIYPEWNQLNEIGHKEGEEVANQLAILVRCSQGVKLYSSREERAIDTAKYTSDRLNIETNLDRRLNEYVVQRDIETKEEALRRIEAFTQDLLAKSSDTAIVFSHAKLLRLYLSRTPNFDRNIKNGEIIETLVDDDKIKVLRRY